MKKVMTVFIFVVGITICATSCDSMKVKKGGAETLSFRDLLEHISLSDISVATDYFMDKGFIYNSQIDAESDGVPGTGYIFTSQNETECKKSDKVVLQNEARYITWSDATKGIGFSTPCEDLYKKMLDDMKDKNFSSIKNNNLETTETSNRESGYTTIYRSPEYPQLEITVAVEQLSAFGEAWTRYSIILIGTP